MENMPAILLFWYFFMAIFILMVALMITAILLIKKGHAQSTKKLRFWGKLCLSFSLFCAVPVIFVMGYILYLSIG